MFEQVVESGFDDGGRCRVFGAGFRGCSKVMMGMVWFCVLWPVGREVKDDQRLKMNQVTAFLVGTHRQ